MKNEIHQTLKNKVAVITGAESGIGQAIAIELGNRGADIVIAYHEDEHAANATLKTIEDNGGKAIIQKTDVSDFKQVQELFKAAHQLGTPYILVNSAGIDASGIPIVDMDIAVFDQTIRANLYGTFYTCKEFIRLRKAAGGQGKIINVSSVHEDIPRAGAAEYCAGKGAIRNLTRCLALELAEFRINVNNIAPGMVLTPMNQEAIDDPKVLEEQVQSIPWKRAAEPWEVAKLAAYLVSEDASYAAGQTFTLDGGLSQNLGQGA